MKKPSIYQNPKYIKVYRKFRNLYNRLKGLLETERFYSLTDNEQSSLINKLKYLYNRLEKFSKHFGLKLAGITVAFTLLITTVDAQKFIEITGPENPLFGEENPIPFDAGNRSSPGFVDIDKDGDFDLFSGNSSGQVVFYKNFYEESGHDSIYFVQQTGSDNLFDGVDVGTYSKLGFVDIDGDSDYDVFIGEKYGTFKLYKNMQEEHPTDSLYFVEEPDTANPLQDLVYMHDGLNPAFVDVDLDGDMDAFIGEKYGSLRFYKNMQVEDANDSIYFLEQTGGNNPLNIDVGDDAAPTFIDIDNDGDYDAFIGNNFEQVRFYQNNLIETGVLTFSQKTGDDNPLDIFANSYGGYYFDPDFVDIDQDGDQDVFIGNNNGTFRYIKNTGNVNSPEFVENPIDIGMNAAPEFADLDNDGDFDVVAGEGYYNETFHYFKNLEKEQGELILQHKSGSGNPFSMANTGGAPVPASVDIDNDGDMDMFFGDKYGDIRFYKNMFVEGGMDSVIFVEQTGTDNPLHIVPFDYVMSPEFTDLDNDGDFDVVIGAYGYYGQPVVYYRNMQVEHPADSLYFVKEAYSAQPFYGLGIPYMSAPALADLDDDGDYDAVFGRYGYGPLNYYKNMKTESGIDSIYFVQQTGMNNPFYGFYPGNRARPDFVDIDDDGDLDLFVGNRYGNFRFYKQFVPPTLENPIDNQTTIVFREFDYDIPSNTFEDKDETTGEELTYDAVEEGTGSLPGWLSFGVSDPTAFLGTPPDTGALDLVVTLTDRVGQSVADTFHLHIINVPPAVKPIADQGTLPDSLFNFTIPSSAFTDPGDSISYSASSEGGGALPGWLSFDDGTRTFTGTPTVKDTFDIEVKVWDLYSDSASDVFKIIVTDNVTPTLANPIPDQTAVGYSYFTYQFPANTFNDDYWDRFTYTATLSSGADLPDWLYFKGSKRLFYGIPDALGTISIRVTATDKFDESATDVFNLQVINNAPTIDSTIPDKTTLAFQQFSFTLYAKTFSDDPGDDLTITATLNDDSPLPSWLSFDANTLTFSGKPSETGTLDIKVTATDNFDENVSGEFELEVYNNPPIVASEIPDQETNVGELFTYKFPSNTFYDNKGDELTFTATLDDDSPLPSWLSFEASAPRTFSGTPTSTGSYDIKVTATDKLAESVSDVFNIEVIETVGIDDVIAEKIDFYPNPVRNVLHISIEKPIEEDMVIALRDITGKTLLNKEVNKTKGSFTIDLDLGNLSEGTYLLSFTTATGRTITKEIVIH